MKKALLFAPIVATLALCSIPLSSFAQSQYSADMTADELEERFKMQKTRGLDLSTPSEVGAFVKVFENATSNTPIMFAIGGAEIITVEADEFEVLCEDLSLSGHAKFEVIGLAQGDPALAQSRAGALKAQLIAECGVSENTLVALARD